MPTVPEMFATWVRDHYEQWAEARPDHLEQEFKHHKGEDEQSVAVFRHDTCRRWEEGNLGDPLDWASYMPAGLDGARMAPEETFPIRDAD